MITGVSILKPLVDSVDPSLFQNLETFFTLDYPKYEIIFCVQDPDDARLKMYVDSLIRKYPKVETQVFYGGEDVGINPKVNNMQPGLNFINILLKPFLYESVLCSFSQVTV